jgi:hypothetical protein
MEEEVHGAQARDVVHQLDALDGFELEEVLLVLRELRVLAHHVLVRCEEEPAGAARRIADPLTRLRPHTFDDRLDQRPRCEVLPGAALGVLRVSFEEPLVGVALHVRAHRRPLLATDEIHHQPAQLGRILDPVLRLAEDHAEHPLLPAQFLENVPVVGLQLVAVPLHQTRPVHPLRHDRRLTPRRLRPLVRHLEEQQERELLDVLEIRKPVVAQDVAVGPELVDDLCGVGHSLN